MDKNWEEEKWERSFVMIKPDGVQRKLIGEILSRFENKGLKITAMKMMRIDEELAAKHYAEHQGKEFYPRLMEFIVSDPVVAMVIEGENAIAIIRKLVGKTKPRDAEPGTIRGDYVMFSSYNIIHASDSVESAERELANFFKPEEILDYKLDIAPWINEPNHL